MRIANGARGPTGKEMARSPGKGNGPVSLVVESLGDFPGAYEHVAA